MEKAKDKLMNFEVDSNMILGKPRDREKGTGVVHSECGHLIMWKATEKLTMNLQCALALQKANSQTTTPGLCFGFLVEIEDCFVSTVIQSNMFVS